MKKTIVRFNRPILIMPEGHQNSCYQTIYGFVVNEEVDDNTLGTIEDYTGYLAALSCIANGDGFFTIDYNKRGLPDWKDKHGEVHTKHDRWMWNVEYMCMDKLNLSYDIMKLDISEELLDYYTNEEEHIVDEVFYYDLLRYKGDCNDDEVPVYVPCD